MSKSDVFSFFLTSHGAPLILERGKQCRADAGERIQYPIAFVRQSQDASLNQLNRKLARMNRLLRMIRFDVWNVPQRRFPILHDDAPYIGWVLAKRVAGRLAVVR